MRYLTVPALCALAVSVTGSALAFDVLLLPDRASGVVRTGAYDDATKSVVSENERVFTGEFGADPLQPNFSDEPGFRALDGAFPAGDSWGFNITDRVYRWDVASQNFDTASPFTITMSYAAGILNATSPTTPGGFTPGFSLTIPGGGFDDHLDIFLDAGASTEADGIYLLRLNLFATGLAASDNVWFVLNRGLSGTEFAAAEQYVRDFIVPAPGACAVFAIGFASAGRRRR